MCRKNRQVKSFHTEKTEIPQTIINKGFKQETRIILLVAKTDKLKYIFPFTCRKNRQNRAFTCRKNRQPNKIITVLSNALKNNIHLAF